jgi:hypothetical protein
MAAFTVRGVPCDLQNDEARLILGEVLDRIQAAQPDDFDRIRRVVREVRPLTDKHKEDGTMGEWFEDKESDDVSAWGYGCGLETPGVLCVDEELPRTEFIAVLAHELGHACVVGDDLENRGDCPEDEWCEEATASWYPVKRWGFRAELESTRSTWDTMHGGPWPGETATVGGTTYLVDEDFRFTRPTPGRPLA